MINKGSLYSGHVLCDTNTVSSGEAASDLQIMVSSC